MAFQQSLSPYIVLACDHLLCMFLQKTLLQFACIEVFHSSALTLHAFAVWSKVVIRPWSWFLWLLHFSNHHYVISYDNQIGYMPKTMVQLALENIASNSGSEGHHCISVAAKFCIKCSQEWWRFIQFLMPISIATITNCHFTSICNQVSYVIWLLEVIGLIVL